MWREPLKMQGTGTSCKTFGLILGTGQTKAKDEEIPPLIHGVCLFVCLFVSCSQVNITPYAIVKHATRASDSNS